MHLTLHLTSNCNMRCSYCYAPPRNGPVMNLETSIEALRLGVKLSERSCGIVFFGGEPLMHKDLIRRILAEARTMEQSWQGRFHFKTTTNGLLLDDEFIRFSIDNGVLIALSVDGVAAAHDAHRKLPDGSPSHHIVSERLQMLLKARPYSSILMTLHPDTVEYLCESVTSLIEAGCRYLIVSPNYAGNWTERSFKTLRRQFRKLADKYIQWTRESRKFYLSPFEVKLSSHINRHCFQKERCELGRKQISVAPDGHLYPCVQFPKAGKDSRFCIGHVDTGIDDKRRLTIEHESSAEKNFCRECAIKDRCNNTCGCLNYQTMGDINQVSPVLCRYEQMLLPIADHIGNTLYKERNPLFMQKHYNTAYPFLSLMEDAVK